MDEFPNSDEELDDFIDKDLYETQKATPGVNIQNATSNAVDSEKSIGAGESLNNIPPSSQHNNIHNDHNGDAPTEAIRKRTYEELISDFGDIFEDDNFVDIPEAPEKKPRWSEPTAVIEYILAERQKNQINKNGVDTIKKVVDFRRPKDSISRRVPQWNFVALTTLDSERLYVKVREKKKNIETSSCAPANLFAIPFSEMKAEAEEIILRNTERATAPPPIVRSKISNKSNDQLWVDKYRPRTYMELLTDESVNRSFLRWIKLWDKIVFGRELVKRKKPKEAPTFGSKKFFHKIEEEGVDEKGFPIHRIVLLSGPPGLGKTTLAHLVAQHAGYNVVEVNSSDDRGPDAFRQALLASTEMRSLMGVDPRPNCLILDEIDGASAASVELLIKYVQGKLLPKGKKKKEGGKNSDGCKRPVICICNEAYAPSLRSLRAMAYIIPVPKISAPLLAQRLATIARKENVKADQGTLLQLAERSGCDIRSCLCALQYMGEACGNSEFSLGLKDTKKGLFDSWKDILQVPMNRGGVLSVDERVQVALKATYGGETERLAQGIFHNYPESSPPRLNVISQALEWFQLFDKINTVVMTKQDWRVMPYTNYAFVAWHFGFASNKFVKLSYPYAAGEANQKLNKNIAILTVTKSAYGRDIDTLAMDITPFMSELLTPRLRSVAGHLYSPREKADLDRIINVMLDFGVSFVQTKNEDRSVDYVLDPNLFEVGVFPDCKVRRTMPYAVKQIVAHELNIKRVERVSLMSKSREGNDLSQSGKNSNVEKEAKNSKLPVPVVPNHLRQLEPMPVQPKKFRNFFESFAPKKTSVKPKTPETSPTGHRFRQVLKNHGVWYKYKEGFSNSVRRKVKISNLL